MKVPDLLTFLEVCCIIFYRCADLKKSQSGSPSEAAKLVRRLSFFVLQDAFAAFVLISDSCTLTPSFLFDRIIAIASNILLASGVFMRFPPCICFPRMDSLLFLRISPLLPLSFHLLCRNLRTLLLLCFRMVQNLSKRSCSHNMSLSVCSCVFLLHSSTPEYNYH